MASPYEMVILYHPDLEIDLDKALKKVDKIVTDAKGKVVKTDSWGKRKLAYPINKEDHAIYVYYDVELESESISKIESSLNITDEVLRYLVVKPGPDIEEEDEAKDKKEDKAKKDSKKSEKAEASEEETNDEDVKENDKDTSDKLLNDTE